MKEKQKLLVVSWFLARLEGLDDMLDDYEILRGKWRSRSDVRAVLAWGRKPSARAAEAFASARGLGVWRMEDGFLRSVTPGMDSRPYSVVLDDRGIYYDAYQESRLERLIAEYCDDAKIQRATRLRALWRKHRVSKYNHARENGCDAREFILVVDQTRGDLSINFGMASEASFRLMLEAAMDENPGSEIVLKTHPDVVSGRKRGHFQDLSPGQASRIRIVGTDVHPCGLLEQARSVYVVTSQMGFEGLIWGKPVRCFGMPFYAGWGLTRDEMKAPARRGRATLEHLVHAALVSYPRYVDPETNRRCEPERLIEWMGLQRAMRGRFPCQIHALGFSRWKQPLARAFFQGSDLAFLRSAARVPDQATIAIWGNKPVSKAELHARQILRTEDGFLRSVGLGTAKTPALSWIIDGVGIHYDATRPSELEAILETSSFDESMLARARDLRKKIVSAGISKYNTGGGEWSRPPKSHVVLVTGQVETDASIVFGAVDVRTNLELVEVVRRSRPDAYLVYKPHPDVVSRSRPPGEWDFLIARLCDEIVTDIALPEMFQHVDEVHVLTSQAGFEALMHGKPVFTYGVPFYAGWGLTMDRHACPRRTRRLTLDELVAGALIIYPTYVSRNSGHFTTPERAIEEILAWRQEAENTPLLSNTMSKIARLFKGVR